MSRIRTPGQSRKNHSRKNPRLRSRKFRNPSRAGPKNPGLTFRAPAQLRRRLRLQPCQIRRFRAPRNRAQISRARKRPAAKFRIPVLRSLRSPRPSRRWESRGHRASQDRCQVRVYAAGVEDSARRRVVVEFRRVPFASRKSWTSTGARSTAVVEAAASANATCGPPWRNCPAAPEVHCRRARLAQARALRPFRCVARLPPA